jgi:hypothetical protein
MSILKLKGNASGTGTVTLEAPNTNTDQTIAIPDGAGSFVTANASGDVAVTGTFTSQGIDDNATSTAVTLDSSGNVGIGVVPTFTPGGSRKLLQVTNGSSGGQISLSNNSNESENPRIFSDAYDLGFATATTGGGVIKFYTGGAEAVRIDALGRPTLSSTHTSNYGLTLTNSASSGVPEGIDIVNTGISVDSSAGHFLRCRDSSATRCVIDLNGNLRNHDNSYGALSDERAKQDIVDASSQWDDIKAIQVRKYKKIDDVEAYGDNAQLEIGVIAQELEASGMGGLVNTPENADEMKSVKYSILYMKAVKALQEAMERIETLETEMTSVKARLDALEAV